MPLSISYKYARSLEAIENFAIATNWQSQEGSTPNSLSESLLPADEASPSNTNSHREIGEHYVYLDKHFWEIVLNSPNKTFGYRFHFDYCALSEWIARIPGLYWSKGGKALRKLANNAIELQSPDWTIYKPPGKSQFVLGGIGTYKFSPDTTGNRLVMLSCGFNASSGIPALISPVVWERYQLSEGDVLWGEASWHEMPQGWAERFPSLKGIPRGCLVISHPDQVHIKMRNQPVQFHPCTVMEYYSGDAILYDFVFATADTHLKDYRQKLERFFESYKTANERYGEYLIPADQSHPLFDAVYSSNLMPGGQSQLRLIEERVRQQSYKGQTIEELLQVLASNCSNDDLQELSRDIRLNPNVWFTGAAAARSANQLLDVCVKMNKVEELVDALALLKPSLIA